MKYAMSALATTTLVGMAYLVWTPAKPTSAQVAPPAPARVPGASNTPHPDLVPRHPQNVTNRWNGPMHADPLASNPEAAELYQQEVEAANEAQALSGQFQQAASDDEQNDLRQQLREALLRQFEAQQARRALEIESIEERLTAYRDKVQKREAAKDMIIDRRLDQLTGVGDDLGWEETGIGPQAGHPFGPPGPQYAPAAMPRIDNVPAVGPPAALAPLTVPGPSAGASAAPWPAAPSAFPATASEPAAAANP